MYVIFGQRDVNIYSPNRDIKWACMSEFALHCYEKSLSQVVTDYSGSFPVGDTGDRPQVSGRFQAKHGLPEPIRCSKAEELAMGQAYGQESTFAVLWLCILVHIV